LVDQALPKLVGSGWIWSGWSHTEDLKSGTCGLSSLVVGADRQCYYWLVTRSAWLTAKAAPWPTAEMGAANH